MAEDRGVPFETAPGVRWPNITSSTCFFTPEPPEPSTSLANDDAADQADTRAFGPHQEKDESIRVEPGHVFPE